MKEEKRKPFGQPQPAMTIMCSYYKQDKKSSQRFKLAALAYPLHLRCYIIHHFIYCDSNLIRFLCYSNREFQ